MMMSLSNNHANGLFWFSKGGKVTNVIVNAIINRKILAIARVLLIVLLFVLILNSIIRNN